LRQATSRSQIYRLFGEALEYPNEARARQIRAGEVATEFEALLLVVAPRLGDAVRLDALADAGDDDEALAVEYTRLFDVGASGPPCPLLGGSYGARMKTMEEVIRFYEHFGLKPSQTRPELPDHLATQLEFLHFLTFSEAEALESGTDPGPFRRAQRDFLARHPGNWVPQLLARLEQH
jgi:DMSO reductase family type II enzyme chaperone